jgi:hypothetical protein
MESNAPRGRTTVAATAPLHFRLWKHRHQEELVLACIVSNLSAILRQMKPQQRAYIHCLHDERRAVIGGI